jgi:soluble lytic murein transglycosylase-like protein
MRWPVILSAGLLAYAGYEWSKQQEEGGAIADAIDTITETAGDIVNSITGYSYAKVPAQYRAAIAASEARHGLPNEMLARLLWQECRYKESIITGRVTSPAGALGIAQFMPATAREMGIDPLDPMAAIDAAGRYLARLYRSTGTWAKALAAYNWGIGNVTRKGLAMAPLETRNYFNQILKDLGMTV